MGGRGSASRIGAGNPNSADYKSAYDIEMSHGTDFAASPVLSDKMTKDTIGYEMYVYENVTGGNLITDTRREIDSDKRALREANSMGHSYGMNDNQIAGMKAGIKEKIKMREKAIVKMTDAKDSYNAYKRQASEAAIRNKGRNWL